MKAIVPLDGGQLAGLADVIPDILVRTGSNAVFAAEEFFKATLNNPHTRRAYGRSVVRFLAWCEHQGVELRQVTPGAGRRVCGQLEGSPRPPRTRPSRRCATSSTAW